MLTLYRRLEGTVEGVYRRHALKVKSWEAAALKAKQIEEDGRPKEDIMTVERAVERFLADCQARDKSATKEESAEFLAKTGLPATMSIPDDFPFSGTPDVLLLDENHKVKWHPNHDPGVPTQKRAALEKQQRADLVRLLQ